MRRRTSPAACRPRCGSSRRSPRASACASRCRPISSSSRRRRSGELAGQLVARAPRPARASGTRRAGAPGRSGSARWTHSVGEAADVLVYPDLPAARRLASAVRAGKFRRRGPAPRGPLGLGTEFESVREYSARRRHPPGELARDRAARAADVEPVPGRARPGRRLRRRLRPPDGGSVRRPDAPRRRARRGGRGRRRRRRARRPVRRDRVRRRTCSRSLPPRRAGARDVVRGAVRPRAACRWRATTSSRSPTSAASSARSSSSSPTCSRSRRPGRSSRRCRCSRGGTPSSWRASADPDLDAAVRSEPHVADRRLPRGASRSTCSRRGRAPRRGCGTPARPWSRRRRQRSPPPCVRTYLRAKSLARL